MCNLALLGISPGLNEKPPCGEAGLDSTCALMVALQQLVPFLLQSVLKFVSQEFLTICCKPTITGQAIEKPIRTESCCIWRY